MKTIFRKLALTLTLAVMVGAASAQEFSYGVQAGVTVPTLSGDVECDAKMGYSVGLTTNYMFNDKWGVGLDAIYQTQGCSVDMGSTYEYSRTNLHYLNVPIMANYQIVDGLSIKAGVQPGFLLGVNSAYKLDGGDRETSDMASAEDSGYEVFDLSIPVGLAYNITDNVYVDARYNIGVTSISKDDNSDLFNNAFVLSVGFRF